MEQPKEQSAAGGQLNQLQGTDQSQNGGYTDAPSNDGQPKQQGADPPSDQQLQIQGAPNETLSSDGQLTLLQGTGQPSDQQLQIQGAPNETPSSNGQLTLLQGTGQPSDQQLQNQSAPKETPSSNGQPTPLPGTNQSASSQQPQDSTANVDKDGDTTMEDKKGKTARVDDEGDTFMEDQLGEKKAVFSVGKEAMKHVPTDGDMDELDTVSHQKQNDPQFWILSKDAWDKTRKIFIILSECPDSLPATKLYNVIADNMPWDCSQPTFEVNKIWISWHPDKIRSALERSRQAKVNVSPDYIEEMWKLSNDVWKSKCPYIIGQL